MEAGGRTGVDRCQPNVTELGIEVAIQEDVGWLDVPAYRASHNNALAHPTAPNNPLPHPTLPDNALPHAALPDYALPHPTAPENAFPRPGYMGLCRMSSLTHGLCGGWEI
eukprot:362754-Chlamydomonas_euryale.AAC.23